MVLHKEREGLGVIPKRARPAGKREKGVGGGSMWVREEIESKPNFYLSSASIFSSTYRKTCADVRQGADNALLQLLQYSGKLG